MLVSKRISWLVCTVDSKAELREYDMVYVLGDGNTLLLFKKLHQFIQQLRHLSHQMSDNQIYLTNSTKNTIRLQFTTATQIR